MQLPLLGKALAAVLGREVAITGVFIHQFIIPDAHFKTIHWSPAGGLKTCLQETGSGKVLL